MEGNRSFLLWIYYYCTLCGNQLHARFGSLNYSNFKLLLFARFSSPRSFPCPLRSLSLSHSESTSSRDPLSSFYTSLLTSIHFYSACMLPVPFSPLPIFFSFSLVGAGPTLWCLKNPLSDFLLTPSPFPPIQLPAHISPICVRFRHCRWHPFRTLHSPRFIPHHQTLEQLAYATYYCVHFRSICHNW